jgi:hypothetical protein
MSASPVTEKGWNWPHPLMMTLRCALVRNIYKSHNSESRNRKKDDPIHNSLD